MIFINPDLNTMYVGCSYQFFVYYVQVVIVLHVFESLIWQKMVGSALKRLMAEYKREK